LRPDLHPEAAKNFEEKAHCLLSDIAPETGQATSHPPTHLFRPGGHVAATYTENEVFDFKITGKTYLFGRTIAKYFEYEGRLIGFEDEKYLELAKLSESVQRTKAFRDFVSTEWVEDEIVVWMKTKYQAASVPSLAVYLAKKREEDVEEHEIWLPVAYLSVESDLTFGNVVFKTITEEFMDRWWEQWKEGTRGRGAKFEAQVEARFNRERSDLQGLAAATIRVTAEPKRALEVALQESERAIAALSVYNFVATTIPNVTSYCKLLGRETVEGLKYLEMEGEKVRSRRHAASGQPPCWPSAPSSVSAPRSRAPAEPCCSYRS